jgi:hypothetical protein
VTSDHPWRAAPAGCPGPEPPSSAESTTDRVWRVRKDHTWIDARIHQRADSADVELQFFYAGEVVFSRRWPTRDRALADADTRLQELQRAGWTTHW